MKIVKTICTDPEKCSDKIKSHFAKDVSILHIPNNHIVTFSIDYDKNGTLKDQKINLLAFQLGGVKKTLNKKIIKPPILTPQNKKWIADSIEVVI